MCSFLVVDKKEELDYLLKDLPIPSPPSFPYNRTHHQCFLLQDAKSLSQKLNEQSDCWLETQSAVSWFALFDKNVGNLTLPVAARAVVIETLAGSRSCLRFC